MKSIRKAFAYLWDLKQRKIEKLEDEARHPFAKKFDEIFNNPLVGGRLVPHNKKNLGKHK